MALDARTRSSLYAKFAELVGDDDANALMSQFPSIEADELVTKQFLRAELSELRLELRGEMDELRAELHGEMNGLRSEFGELRSEFGELRSEFGELRSEFVTLRGDVGREIGALRADMLDRFHQQTVWFGGALGAATALLAAIGLIA